MPKLDPIDDIKTYRTVADAAYSRGTNPKVEKGLKDALENATPDPKARRSRMLTLCEGGAQR